MSIDQWMRPVHQRFDPRAGVAMQRCIITVGFTCMFMSMYPLTGGIFFRSGIVMQALLIPIFFMIRAIFEYGADALTSELFGSDGMPALNFMGVMMHEICLSVMITSVKHPLVFVSLILSDVLENSFCLWSLAKNTIKASRVVPMTVVLEDEEKKKKNKSLLKRSSNVVSLVLSKEDVKDKGTALFIAATLLQREAVETLMPMQAAAILSVLYYADINTNSIVSTWSHEDWKQSMMYIGVDLGVELIVFAGTVLVLRRIYPEFDAGRILRGLLRTHWMEMMMFAASVWGVNLLYQSTYGGMDMTMKFEWLRCVDRENSTWLGGYDWEC